MAKIVKNGYGQVEPNHLSAQRTGQIYAQLPAAAAFDMVENGMFLKYDLVAGEMNTTGAGEDMLVYSEIKLYDKNRQGYKDFALLKSDAVGGKIYPRLFKTNVGDIFTTNLADVTSAEGSRVGKKFVIANGVLTEEDAPVAGAQVWVAVKETTMPDGQKAIKFQRVA
jgi:hypothetical protein